MHHNVFTFTSNCKAGFSILLVHLFASLNLPLLSSFLPQTICFKCSSCTLTNKLNIFKHTLQKDLCLTGWYGSNGKHNWALPPPRRLCKFEWDNEVIGERPFFACYSKLLILVICCIPCLLASSLTFNPYMVRASVHAGDPAELCDTGHVSSLWGHRLQIGEVQDPGGKTLTFHARLV